MERLQRPPQRRDVDAPREPEMRLTLKARVVNRAHAVVPDEHEAVGRVERLMIRRGRGWRRRIARAGVCAGRAELVPCRGSVCLMQSLAGAIGRIDTRGRHGGAF